MDFVGYGMELITQKAVESIQDYTDFKLNIVQPRINEQESAHKPCVICELQFSISVSGFAFAGFWVSGSSFRVKYNLGSLVLGFSVLIEARVLFAENDGFCCCTSSITKGA